jgi:hypothetical protein
MTSFQITLTPSRRAAARFIGQVRRALQKAYVEEQLQRGLSQTDIARLLKVHRSVINRELKGLKDMTLGRVAELSWAMGRQPLFTADRPVQMAAGANHVTGSQQLLSNAPSPPPPTATSPNRIPGLPKVTIASAA